MIKLIAMSVIIATNANLNKFEAIKPGLAAKCVHGGEYTFFVRKGTVNKVVFELEGGGACWNEASCALPIHGGPAHHCSEMVHCVV